MLDISPTSLRDLSAQSVLQLSNGRGESPCGSMAQKLQTTFRAPKGTMASAASTRLTARAETTSPTADRVKRREQPRTYRRYRLWNGFQPEVPRISLPVIWGREGGSAGSRYDIQVQGGGYYALNAATRPCTPTIIIARLIIDFYRPAHCKPGRQKVRRPTCLARARLRNPCGRQKY